MTYLPSEATTRQLVGDSGDSGSMESDILRLPPGKKSCCRTAGFRYSEFEGQAAFFLQNHREDVQNKIFVSGDVKYYNIVCDTNLLNL